MTRKDDGMYHPKNPYLPVRLRKTSIRKRIPQEVRKRVYNKTKGYCAYCGEPLIFSATQIDHVVPFEFADALLVLGHDVNSEENLFPVCRPCNNYKHTLTIEKLRKCIEAWPDVLYKGNTTYRNAVRFGVVIAKKKRVMFYFEEIGLKAPDWLNKKGE